MVNTRKARSRAFSRSFAGSASYAGSDCWSDDPTLVIEVALEIDLGAADETFEPFLDEAGVLWVAKRSLPGEGGREALFVTRRRASPDFSQIRAQTQATAAKDQYEELDPDKYAELPAWTNFAALTDVLEEWEAGHPEELGWVEDGSIGFGSGKVDLARYIEPVFVPAVHDAVVESKDSKSSVLGTLIERIVNPKALFEDRTKDLDAEVGGRYEAMLGEGDDALVGASDTISERLGQFAPGAEVVLTWEGRPPTIATPSVRARLVEGGHLAEIGRQGHGLQRAYILALLHELAEKPVIDEESRPNLFMMIEEPELYQHPSRARLLARVLLELATQDSSRTQVLYATHSPQFVGLDRIDSLRVLRLTPDHGHSSTVVSSVNLAELAQRLWVANGSQGDPYTAESLKPRLRLLGQVPVADGFFADGVVLVEGEEDRAFLLAAAQGAGLDFDASNIAVIPVGGKTNLDRPLLVFGALGIPVFTMFDADSHANVKDIPAHERTNRLLTSLLDVEPEGNLTTQVADHWACFEENFERTIRAEMGDGWEGCLQNATDEAGFMTVDQAMKNPTVIQNAYEAAQLQGSTSVTLDAVLDTIRARFALAN